MNKDKIIEYVHNLECMADEDYQSFIMALVKLEKNENDFNRLNKLYRNYMESSYGSFLIELFDFE